MHKEKVTKLEQQIFIIPRKNLKISKLQLTKQSKDLQYFSSKCFQHSSCSNSGHGSGSEASACFSSNSAMSNKSTPKKVQRPSKHRQSHKASHKRGKKKTNTTTTLYKETSIPIDEVFKATQNNYCLLAFSICF